MTNEHAQPAAQLVYQEWVGFPGGELEGKRPKGLCLACREALRHQTTTASHRSSPSRLLCFQCYRADMDRERALAEAGAINTASEARFQSQLPFEPVNRARLEMLKMERAEARTAASGGIGKFVDKRRHAQIAARRALQAIASGLKAQQVAPAIQAEVIAVATHAAELQLPEAWLPFVVARCQR